MKSINLYYENVSNLRDCIKTHDIEDSPSLLIQVFTSFNDKHYIEKLIKAITSSLPNAIIIGSTTDGEIMNGSVTTGTTVINFTEFKHTYIEAKSVVHKKDGYYSGQYLANTLVMPNTKILIAFVDGLTTNGEAFLDGIASIRADTVVAGGLAGDNAQFEQTYVFTKEGVVRNGAVAVALSGHRLQVNTDYALNQKEVGKELTITKAEKNRVYKIGEKTAVETFAHYLGNEAVKLLPDVGIDFPLMVRRGNTLFARSVISIYKDGSMVFSGNLKEGEKVRFGYADTMEMINNANQISQRISEYPIDVLFVYSCLSRRHFLPDSIENETLALQDIAPVSGFFANGEFFTKGRVKLFNQAITVLSLSESKSTEGHVKKRVYKPKVTFSSTNALVNLINMATLESMEEKAELQDEVRRDVLTGLPNRKLFMEEMAKITNKQKLMSLFFVDLDKFKDINDTYGHHIGDKVIMLMGKRLKKSLRSTDVVVRFGGDEFIVILNDTQDAKIITTKANILLKTIAKPIVIDEYDIDITASIGISNYPKDVKNVEKLLKYADMAMYAVKKKGGNNYAFYEKGMTESRT